MSSDRQLNYVNDLQNRDQKLYYVDDASELNSINLEENDKIYAINDNKLFQMEIADQEEELSGSIVSFNGRNNTKIKSLVANIEPVQDLHGYDSPWPAGGGMNLFDESVYSDAAQYSVYSGNYRLTPPLMLKPNTQYTFSPSTSLSSLGSVYFAVYVISGDDPAVITGDYYYVIYNGNTQVAPYIQNTFTTGNTGAVRFAVNSYTIAYNLFPSIFTANWQLELGSTATDWTPYENICPISGWTGAEIKQTGKNLLDHMACENKAVNANGKIYGLKTRLLSSVIRVEKNRAYSVSVPFSIYFIGYVEYNEDGTWKGNYFNFDSGNDATFTPTTRKIRLYFRKADSTAAITANELIGSQLELGSTATDYVPYTSNQISINWQTEAGTVYGGMLTVNPDRTGTLTNNHRLDVFNGNYTFSLNSETDDYMLCTAYLREAAMITSDQVYVLSNWAKFYNGYLAGTITFRFALSTSNRVLYVWVPKTMMATVAEFNQFVINNPLQILYTTWNTYDYQLTAEQVSGILTTFYGPNNIWSNIGDITIKIAEKGITAFELEPHI